MRFLVVRIKFLLDSKFGVQTASRRTKLEVSKVKKKGCWTLSPWLFHVIRSVDWDLSLCKERFDVGQIQGASGSRSSKVEGFSLKTGFGSRRSSNFGAIERSIRVHPLLSLLI